MIPPNGAPMKKKIRHANESVSFSCQEVIWRLKLFSVCDILKPLKLQSLAALSARLTAVDIIFCFCIKVATLNRLSTS